MHKIVHIIVSAGRLSKVLARARAGAPLQTIPATLRPHSDTSRHTAYPSFYYYIRTLFVRCPIPLTELLYLRLHSV